MDGAVELIERRIPDVVPTRDLPVRLAAEIDFLAGRFEPWLHSSASGVAVRARALVMAGAVDDARVALDALPSATLPPGELAAASWAASRVGPPPVVERLLAELAAAPAPFLIDDIPFGPTDLFAGVLLASQGHLDASPGALRNAVVVGDARAPVWGALARIELARVLRCAAAVTASGDASAADSVAFAARTFFAAGGYRAQLARLGDDPVDRVAGVGPTMGTLRPGPSWLVGFGVQPVVSVKSSKGLVALHHLLVNRQRPVPVAELVRMLGDEDGEATAETTRTRTSKLLRRTIAKLADTHHLLSVHLDATVRTGLQCQYVDGGSPDVTWLLSSCPAGGGQTIE